MSHRWLDSATAAILLITACWCGSAWSQDSALLKRLQNAERAQSLDDPALKPWHLKLSVDLHDQQGKPGETGTIEEWWVAPGRFRRVFAFPSYSATELRLGDRLLRTAGKTQPPYVLRQLLENEVHPMHLAEHGREFHLELRSERGEQKSTLDCIVVHPPGVSTIDPDLFPRYCFQPGDTLLILKRDSVQADMVGRGGIFQGRYAPAELEIVMGGLILARQQVVSLTVTTAAEARLDATAGLAEVRNDPILVRPDAEGAKVIHYAPRAYPRGMMRGRARVMVVLRAVFGSDGKPLEVSVLASPGEDYSKTAIDVVRHAKRDPYEVDGKAVAVESLVALRLR